MLRQRIIFLAALIVVGALGYWLRFNAPVPAWLRDNSGGAAYVLFWILALAVVKPAASARRLALLILAITCCLEFLQLWHPRPLEAMRRTFVGRMILGTTFDWSDFPPYALGACLGWAALRILRAHRSPPLQRMSV